MSNTIKNTLLAGGAALLLSGGVALAAPATAESGVNVRSGPGTNYAVIGALSAGETVDAGNCGGGWCQVSFSGGTGYVSGNYLAFAGGAPGVGVAVETPVYTPYAYGYDDDDYGPDYGFYGSPVYGWSGGWRGRWRGGHHAGNWNHGGFPGGHHAGNWNHGGNWARGGNPGGHMANRPGSVTPQVSAPTGMHMGGGFRGGAGMGGGAHGGGAHVGGGHFGGGAPGGGQRH
jgi:uncharacterized protein YraI